MPGDSDEVTDVPVVATTAADMPRDTAKVTDESVAATTFIKVTGRSESDAKEDHVNHKKGPAVF